MAGTHHWWDALRHGGLLLSPSRLAECFPDDPAPLPNHLAAQLRRDLTRLEAGTAEADRQFLDTVLEQVCGLTGQWEKGNQVGGRWSQRSLTGEIVKPRRVWYGPRGAIFPVFILKGEEEPRLGVGRTRRSVSRVIEWLRQTGLKVALLTNLRQFRLIHAGLDYDAHAEWDTALWFEEGRPGLQVQALQALLNPQVLTPIEEGQPASLLAAIEASRRGQAELSAELGERVRQAVELVIRTHGPSLGSLDESVSPRHIYLAATRVIMRMVVVLFAEARDLLPRENPIYHQSYGLQGLREGLERVGGGAASERLRYRRGAWPRILALFRLVHQGSHHALLPVPRYGGDLFAPGATDAEDPLRRALAAFEQADHDHSPTDAEVLQILTLLCRTRIKVRQGRGSTWMMAPVDFSDLSSEYIGILYEGLLDYELRRADADDPMVFLRLGDEPVLPLSRLEAMDDRQLAGLVEKLKVKRQAVASEEEGEDEDKDEEEGEELQELADAEDEEAEVPLATAEAPSDEPSLEESDHRHRVREQARAWARKAVTAGKLVPKPRGGGKEAQQAHEQAVGQMADQLVAQVILPGEWFLVRWGGTRKGAGTFYTRPQLAVPTAQRTLRPLAFEPPADTDRRPNEAAPAAEWTPKKPETILALKICDPAMGSGSFLVASLRFLTDALFASLHQHGRLRTQADQTIVTLAEGRPANGGLVEDLLPCRSDAPEFESRLKARLKRYIVERSLYGVDLDPLAVELARLALWIETMDRDLPFEFLDHKLKVGSALVGCWFDRFRDYPALAWEREGGDKNHSTAVHFEKGAWTKAIKDCRNTRIKAELAAWIAGQRSLLDEIEGRSPESLHEEALTAFEHLHTFPIHETEERARYYQEHIVNHQALRRVKHAFDTWCAIWFWPPDRLDSAPMPRTFENPLQETKALVARLTEEYRFFHWELEFPDVFTAPGSGFDAMVGNPPWEIQKPNSKEYFSNLDPLYRTYGKQDALAHQKELFGVKLEDEKAWLDYNARFKALANFGKNAARPFGDEKDGGESFSFGRGSMGIHATWRALRAGRRGYADQAHPFRYQGSADINTYKLFLEQSHALLRASGQLGMITPSGVYTDKGSTVLRRLFLTICHWRWLFGIINWNKIFESIYYRFKFCVLIVEKGGVTTAVRSAFSRYHVEEWEKAEDVVILYPRVQIERFSPRSLAFLETRSSEDMRILEKIYANSVLLGNEGPEGWGIKYATEFHMTNDSKLFPPRPEWEAKGYQADEYGRWLLGRWRTQEDGIPASAEGARWKIKPGIILSRDKTHWIAESDIEDIALPLYEGRMIGQFDFSKKEWTGGRGRSADWPEIPYDQKHIGPQYMMSASTYNLHRPDRFGSKVGYMDVSSATNKRSMIACFLYDWPCGNRVNLFKPKGDELHSLFLTSLLNSFIYDWALRQRLGGIIINYFIAAETPLPSPLSISRSIANRVGRFAASLSLIAPVFSPSWLRLKRFIPSLGGKSLAVHWALQRQERLRILCMLDAVAIKLFGLGFDDACWILRMCDQPRETINDSTFYRTLDPKGFWRVDKEVEPELRRAILTQVALNDLEAMIRSKGGNRDAGIEAFLTQNNDDGWMLPETFRLDDLGLGHDRRAKEAQPIRSRLGDRFLPWQLEQSVEESWAECERHARNILGEAGFGQLLADARGGETASVKPLENTQAHASESGTLFGDLMPSAKKGRRRRHPGDAL